MFKASLYIYLLFLVFLVKMIKDGYWKGIFTGIIYKVKKNYFWAGILILIGVTLVFSLDKIVNNFMVSHRSEFMGELAKFSYEFGKGEVLFSFLLVFVFIFLLFGYSKLYKIFAMSLMSSVYAGIIVNVLKCLFSRERPLINSNPYKFFSYFTAYDKGELFKFSYVSMPSGHTITIFAAVVPLYIFIKNKVFRIFLITLALVISIGRIYMHSHWLSDVYVGALCGILIGYQMYQINKSRLIKR